MSYETKFSDGSIIDNYMAVGIAEGFEESNAEEAIERQKDIIRAWSYICGTKLYRGLQGWFGRNVASFIEQGYMQDDGTVNWESIDEMIEI